MSLLLGTASGSSPRPWTLTNPAALTSSQQTHARGEKEGILSLAVIMNGMALALHLNRVSYSGQKCLQESLLD